MIASSPSPAAAASRKSKTMMRPRQNRSRSESRPIPTAQRDTNTSKPNRCSKRAVEPICPPLSPFLRACRERGCCDALLLLASRAAGDKLRAGARHDGPALVASAMVDAAPVAFRTPLGRRAAALPARRRPAPPCSRIRPRCFPIDGGAARPGDAPRQRTRRPGHSDLTRTG